MAHSRTYILIGALILIGASILIVYHRAPHNGFVFDDDYQIVHNPWIRDAKYLPHIFSSGVWNFREFSQNEGIYYRPFMHVVFMAEFHFFGTRPAGYHWVNIGLHFIVAGVFLVLLLAVLRRLAPEVPERSRFGVALLSSLFFALHPANSEAVYWVSAIPELTYTLFFLLSLHGFLLMERHKAWILPSLGCFAFALLCKETAITLPLLLFGYAFSFGESRATDLKARARRSILATFPFFLAAAGYLVLRHMILRSDPQVQAETLFWGAVALTTVGAVPELLVRSVLQAVFPFRLSLFHGYVPTNLGAVGAAAILVPVAWFWAMCLGIMPKTRLSRPALFGLLLFTAPLLPALNYVYLNEYALSERYLYLPSMGFALLLSLFLFWLGGKGNLGTYQKGSAVFLVILILGTYAWMDMDRSQAWSSNLALYRDAAAKYPASSLAHLNLAATYCDQGEVELCMQEYAAYCRRMTATRRYTPEECWNQGSYFNMLGTGYQRMGNLPFAIAYQKKAVGQNPDYAQAHRDLASAYLAAGDEERALSALADALQADPESESVWAALGNLECKEGNTEEARAALARALELGFPREEVGSGAGPCLPE